LFCPSLLVGSPLIGSPSLLIRILVLRGWIVSRLRRRIRLLLLVGTILTLGRLSDEEGAA
jgi:hypothetical protein